MIVQMPTKAQAAKVAKLTGWLVLCDDQGRPTTKVKLDDFDAHREAVESVSVLFRCFDDHGTEVPSGWVLTGATFEVEWPKEPGAPFTDPVPLRCSTLREELGACPGEGRPGRDKGEPAPRPGPLDA
jgi:hypothetical protein